MRISKTFRDIFSGIGKKFAHLIFFSLLIFADRGFADFLYVVTGEDKNWTQAIDTSTNQIFDTIVGPPGSNAEFIAITPDGRFSYVTNGNDATVIVIALATNTIVATIPVGANPVGIAISPNGKFAYVANQSDGSVSVIDLSTNMVSATINLGPVGPTALAVTPDSRFLYVTQSSDSMVAVIDTSTNLPVALIMVGAGPNGIAITPNGQFAYVTNFSDDTVSVIDISMNMVIATIPMVEGADVYGIAVSPDGSLVYAVEPHLVDVIDTSTNMVVNTIPLPPMERGQQVVFSLDGTFAYVTMNTGSVVVIDTTTSMIVEEIPLNTGLSDTLGIATTFGAATPSNFSGCQRKNDFGVEYELFNTLVWQPNPLGTPTGGYIIFRNGVQIASLNAGTFKYKDHNIKKGVTYTYTIVAVLSNGVPSVVATITIPCSGT
jgi:YVTN family beta-propeller protein